MADYGKEFCEQLKVYEPSKENTKALINTLSNAVNNFCFKQDEIIEEAKKDPVAYENLIELSYEWVKLWNEADEYCTDGRNEMSTKLCKEFGAALSEKDGYICNEEKFQDLREPVLRMHRTLVQSSSNIFLNVLYKERPEVQELMEKKYSIDRNKDFELPMI